LLLWQDWGVSLAEDVLAGPVVELLDSVATAIADPGVSLSVVQEWSAHELLRVPPTVAQWDPVSLAFSQVDVSRALTKG
jgi:hypothetical protein